MAVLVVDPFSGHPQDEDIRAAVGAVGLPLLDLREELAEEGEEPVDDPRQPFPAGQVDDRPGVGQVVDGLGQTASVVDPRHDVGAQDDVVRPGVGGTHGLAPFEDPVVRPPAKGGAILGEQRLEDGQVRQKDCRPRPGAGDGEGGHPGPGPQLDDVRRLVAPEPLGLLPLHPQDRFRQYEAGVPNEAALSDGPVLLYHEGLARGTTAGAVVVVAVAAITAFDDPEIDESVVHVFVVVVQPFLVSEVLVVIQGIAIEVLLLLLVLSLLFSEGFVFSFQLTKPSKDITLLEERVAGVVAAIAVALVVRGDIYVQRRGLVRVAKNVSVAVWRAWDYYCHACSVL